MVLEGSTGFSGTFARQVSLNADTADEPLTAALLDALESTAREGGVVLECDGLFMNDKASRAVTMQYTDQYKPINGSQPYRRQRLVQLAREGKFIGTFTARHGAKADYDHPQPALWTLSDIHRQSGRQRFPELFGENKTMTIHGRHIRDGAHVLVNGRRVRASIKFGEKERLEITLTKLPPIGTHYLQVQNADGLFSNDFIFHVTADKAAARSLRQAVQTGDRTATLAALAKGADPNARIDDDSTLLSEAAFHGQLEVMKLLLNKGAKVNSTNEDGNTPLHVAAFMGRTEMVQLLLAKGAGVTQRNNRRDTPIDSVSGEWNEGLAGFYRSLNNSAANKVDLAQIQKLRPQLAKLLREHAAKQRR